MATDAARNIEALTESVRKQREIAKDAIDAAKNIDDILSDPSIDPLMKAKLEETKKSFLKVTRDLVANTVSSSSAVELTLDLISNLTKR